MKNLRLIVPILIPLCVFGQPENTTLLDSSGQGIQFENGKKWNWVLAEAKKENKYIFIDCYATWCGPCKEMDKSVYSIKKIGDFFSHRFISIKLQADTSSKDDNIIKSWYSDAHHLLEKYKPRGYPAFIFLDADGRIVDKSEGIKNVDEFIKLAEDAISPDMNYYELLKHFKKGQRNLKDMSYLAYKALSLEDTATAYEVSDEYFNKLKDKVVLTKENVDFMYSFTKSSKSKGFSFFYRYADTINVIMSNDTYSQKLVQDIIFTELVAPKIEEANKSGGSVPDWEFLASTIKKNYNEYYALRVITAARSSWALRHKDWKEYTKYLVFFQDQFGSKSNGDLLMGSLSLNNYAWQVFQLSNNTSELNKALSWSSRAVMMYPIPNWIDTYANILYKLGHEKQAIMWEENALKLEPQNQSIQINLEKMKNGVATWSGN